ncbi:ead/Ea22-like family protein [Escherichia coli]|uniref:ead/Ea22-like family protein n=1 Tax=Escherichia coli TaxID=562 RepID=UPI0010AAEC96|nr:ead/Ea22-like family protein [Escherichia coli]TIJ02808.1 ead/Ea22-like family protein [Escherichia coli]TIJ79190.1 ead/Ea22-like family protein [Escherichia coli]TIK34796.1 ead/Ea22-like family protein [Escherichia coli]HAN8245848.1 ead/Ea22-like family protein [Escherichia coli]
MTKINYQALREAAENATPGEWCADDYHGVIADDGLNANYYIASCSGPDNRANKRFIAAANPATVLALLDELEAAEKRIAELESGSQAQKLVEAIIVAIENEQERLFDEDYLMDSKECIDVIREEVKRWNDSRAAGIRIKGE